MQRVETTCVARRRGAFIGQSEEAIYGLLGNLRVVHPGDDVEDDMNPNRLTAVIGNDGRVLRFGCY